MGSLCLTGVGLVASPDSLLLPRALVGDEFPITWSSDGSQYTGAGDNTQPSPGMNQSYNSPASFFRVKGGPTDPTFPDAAFDLRGDPFAVSVGPPPPAALLIPAAPAAAHAGLPTARPRGSSTELAPGKGAVHPLE